MDRILMMLLAGFLDALNPCALTTAGVLGFFLFLFRDSRFLVRTFVFQAVSFYFGIGFVFQSGWGAEFFLSIFFQLIAAYFYLSMGTIFIALGFWLFWVRGRVRNQGLKPGLPSVVVKESALLKLMGSLLGVILAVPVVYWPQHWWLTTVANEMLLPGKWLSSAISLILYGIARLWPILLITWAYRSIRREGICAGWAAKYSSLVFTISAAFYAGVGIGLILYFSQKL
jgi:hypothetical protein